MASQSLFLTEPLIDSIEFFDAYHWHLDERPLKKDDEINPDVLGYIFEKYINQKQMGAYYTKEDITEYISKNTVIPFSVRCHGGRLQNCFRGRSINLAAPSGRSRSVYLQSSAAWDFMELSGPETLIKMRGNRCSGRCRCRRRLAKASLLLSQTSLTVAVAWNEAASPEYALPNESWRDVASRRNHHEEIRSKLEAGKINSINDLITYNLEFVNSYKMSLRMPRGPNSSPRSGMQSVQSRCWIQLAALARFSLLRSMCLIRFTRLALNGWVFSLTSWGEDGKRNHPSYFKLFTETLNRVKDHPNHRYFVLKSIIVNNLFGVDIMEEAVEICRLRLFLKLIAQIEHSKDIEPLPDIDFNIQAGNSLVGFTKLEEVRAAAENESYGQGRIVFGETENQLRCLEDEAALADKAFQKFPRDANRTRRINQGLN